MKACSDWSSLSSYLKHNLSYLDHQILAVSASGFTRLGLSLLGLKFYLLTALKSLDLSDFPKNVTVYVSQKPAHSSYSILETNQSLVKTLPVKYLAAYKSSPKIKKLGQQLNLKLLVAPWHLRQQLENKKSFYLLKKRLHLNTVPFSICTSAQILDKSWDWWLTHQKIPAVFQDAQTISGGGLGTFIMRTRQQHRQLQHWLKNRSEILCPEYIHGQEITVNGCLLSHGIVMSEIRYQLVDKFGRFYGHSWGHVSSVIHQQVDRAIKQLGQYLHARGYRGIFGLDMFVDKKDKVYLGECNARLTGNLPISTFLQLWRHLIPIEVLHYLAFFDKNFSVNPDLINQSYKNTSFQGGHIILRNRTNKSVTIQKTLKPGLYAYNQGGFKWLKPALGFFPPESNQFILTDGLMPAGTLIKPNRKLARLIFSRPILNSTRKLTDFAAASLNWVVNQLLPTAPANRFLSLLS
ncbi:MAG: hypothetical protein GXP43_00045 [bacterium]|nr:hypothetical protein [bacterium]